jgi:hypothetical protein
VKALEYRPSLLLVILTLIGTNLLFLYSFNGYDFFEGLNSIKFLLYLVFLNTILYLGFKNTMNGFVLTDSFLIVSNSWRLSYKKEIKISDIRRVYERNGTYDDFIVLVMKNEENQSFSTRRLSRVDKESLISETNKLVTG